MRTSVSEMKEIDVARVVDYFIHMDIEFLKGMGAVKSKLPNREKWITQIVHEVRKEYQKKELFYIIWLLDDEPVGHSNVNNIKFGESATMHLHLWDYGKHKKGLGGQFLKKTIPYYFEKLKLKKLICEPYAKNYAPNKLLKGFGFDFIKSYDTIPGNICFYQTVNRYELPKSKFKL